VPILILAVPITLVVWWACTVILALVCMWRGANRRVRGFGRLRWAWAAVLAGNVAGLPLPVVWLALCGPPPGDRFAESTTITALFWALLFAALMVQVGALVGALRIRPSAEVCGTHRRLLPVVWASLAANSLAYWGAARMLLTLTWLG
jgi:hypothetical protein